MPENNAKVYAHKKDNNQIEPPIIDLINKHFKIDVLNIMKKEAASDLTDYLSEGFEDSKMVTQILEYLISLTNDELVQAFLQNDVHPDEERIKSSVVTKYYKKVEEDKNAPEQNRNITKLIKFDKGYLKPLVEEDSEKILEEAKKEHFKEYDDLNTCLAFYDDETFNFLSIFNENDDLVGFIALRLMDDQGFYKYDLAMYLIPKFRKQNYMYLAAKAMIDAAFDKRLLVLEDHPYFNYKYTAECLIIRIIHASVDEKDERTNKLLKKLGFRFDGVERLISKDFKEQILNIYTLPTNTKYPV